jgi:hypothetical protein
VGLYQIGTDLNQLSAPSVDQRELRTVALGWSEVGLWEYCSASTATASYDPVLGLPSGQRRQQRFVEQRTDRFGVTYQGCDCRIQFVELL